MPSLISLQHVFKIYRTGGQPVYALSDVSLEIARGEMVAVVGQSGSGKSTLMNMIGCLDTPSKGRYILDGRDVSTLPDKALSAVRCREIGFVFQKFHLIPDLTAFENVELPLIYRGFSREQRRKMVKDSLRRVGLCERMHHRPGEMSGGQQQRVAIARAIAARPPIILADEPTGNLDSSSGKMVMALLGGLHDDGHTVVLITHDETIAAACARVVKMCDGKLFEK